MASPIDDAVDAETLAEDIRLLRARVSVFLHRRSVASNADTTVALDHLRTADMDTLRHTMADVAAALRARG